MSEELAQRGLAKSGLRLSAYEFFNIGTTTLNQLKKSKIIPNRVYRDYGARKPDALLVDRRNKNRIRVVLVIERKDRTKFSSEKDKRKAIESCNDISQVLKADIGIATDGFLFSWFNPNQKDPTTEYEDKTTGKKRSYTIIKDEDGRPFLGEFIIMQKTGELDIARLEKRTRRSLEDVERVRKAISSGRSQLIKESTIDPTDLAKQIWQDVWSVTGAKAEKCLYTFVELFIFKYLSDLGILDEDDKGNKINFNHIFSLPPEKAFKNYWDNVRDHLRKMFPVDKEDNTTIINGTLLKPNVLEHSQVFYKILKKFHNFGEIRNIDPGFKSRLFEEFMKESISKKNWGRFFTPRNIIDAMVQISDIDKLEEGSRVCDPACGVGGFILEPIKIKKDGVNFYYRVEGDEIKSRYKLYGFDKGFEEEEQLTIILAKANMLIFLSELLTQNPTISTKFAELFNNTFKLLTDTILGTLNNTEKDKYDLILSNPPYVTSGSANYKTAIRKDSRLSDFYRINATGVEGLFLEWIIRSLKPSKKAFIIIPDGILNRLNDSKLRRFVKDECIIDAIISLPVNAFYRNPKKTYILCITKKSGSTEIERKRHDQMDPVFTYLVSNTGETLDVKRFRIPDNDLNEMTDLFNQFKGAKMSFEPRVPRCKIQSINQFDPNEHWSVDRWWSREERIALGIEDQEVILNLNEFTERVKDTYRRIGELSKRLDELR